MLRIPRRIARFEAATHWNFARDCDEVATKNDICHEGALDRMLIAKIFQSGRNVAGERLAYCGLDFSKNIWPLGIFLFRLPWDAGECGLV
jgi:hypothetical protein